MGKKLAVFGWALYDFANTIFSMNVISLYFVLWVTVDNRCEDVVYSIVLSGSLFLAAVAEPLLGAVSDIFKKRIPFLVFFTLLACAFTAVLGIAKTLFMALAVFVLANFCYQTATVFYNALLAKVAGGEEVGRVSGLGAGLGYLGAIVGLIVTRPFVMKYGHQAAFIPTAVLFFLFSLPCFFLVKEEGVFSSGGRLKIQLGSIFLRIKETFMHSEKYPGLLRFLVAAFIFLNAVNTVIVFMSVYLKKVGRFSDSELISLYLVSTLMALAGAFVFGTVVDRVGAKKSLVLSLMIWTISLFAGAFAFSRIMFWIVAPLIGIALGSVWTASRALVVKLTPEDKLGEVFGLLGTVGKSSAIIGPLIWGGTIFLFGFLGVSKYRLGILIQSLFILSGWFIVRKVPEERE